MTDGVPLWLLATLLGTLALAAACWIFSFQRRDPVWGPLSMLGVLAGGFVLLAAWVPQASGVTGVLAFLTTIGLFKLMGYFERRS